jgi:hypothetical protein
MAVCVAIEARHAPARLFRTAILGLVELLLRKWREVQFDLPQIKSPVTDR